MRAAIDIGSNSVRLGMSDGTKHSVITKLADGIEKTGRLSPLGTENTLAALAEFKALIAGKTPESVFVFATEAIRRATDGTEFVARVKRETGFDVAILSPEAEARFALIGAKKKPGAAAVCDLGGGSMELIASPDGKTPEYIKSLPIGVVVLKNRYNGDYRAAIDEAPALIKEYGDIPDYPLTVMGGSICTAAAGLLNLPTYNSDRINGLTVTARELDDFLPVLMSDRLAVFRPVCARRADTVAYGAIVIQALLNHMGQTSFTVSDSSNLEAALSLPRPEEYI